MSQRLLSYTFDFAAVDGDELLLMLCIAHFSDDADICRLSMTNMAELTRLSLRRVTYLMGDLCADGFVEMKLGSSRFEPCTIRLLAVDYDGRVPTKKEFEEISEDEDEGGDGDDIAALFA